MSSQLWQRLRAARKFADLTQAQLASVCNITRSGYAFFESSDDNSRTRPNTDQIMAIARTTRVPIEWLLNDTSDPGDVWKIGVVASVGPKQAMAPAPSDHNCPIRKTDRMEETFWRAVEYNVASRDPYRVEAFEAIVHVDSLEMPIRYQHEKVIACFCTATEPQMLTLYLGRLLLYERALQRTMHKHLLVWTRHQHDVDLSGFVQAVQKGFGISVQLVNTAEEAAEYLLSQN